jgi:hypothetical protein
MLNPVIKKGKHVERGLKGNVGSLTRQQQQQLEQKPEQVVTNFDRCPLVFSKKHSFILNQNLNDFYVIKLRRPLTDDKAVI